MKDEYCENLQGARNLLQSQKPAEFIVDSKINLSRTPALTNPA
jgi:hypothetical protein